jgi:Na+/glutamate symporter
MIELSASDIIILGTALKNSRSIFTAYITDSITGGIILTFKRKTP